MREIPIYLLIFRKEIMDEKSQKLAKSDLQGKGSGVADKGGSWTSLKGL